MISIVNLISTKAVKSRIIMQFSLKNELFVVTDTNYTNHYLNNVYVINKTLKGCLKYIFHDYENNFNNVL